VPRKLKQLDSSEAHASARLSRICVAATPSQQHPKSHFHAFFESSWGDSRTVSKQIPECASLGRATTVVALSQLGTGYEMISHPFPTII
jgi:hypothetical protein